MTRYLFAAIGILALVGFGAGCDSGSETAGTSAPVDSSKAGPNRRLNIKAEYKDAIKDGKLIMKPGMKKPGSPPR